MYTLWPWLLCGTYQNRLEFNRCLACGLLQFHRHEVYFFRQHAHFMTKARKIHIALYSPGIVGLGHLRRNLLISQILADSELQSINLMVTEAREASVFIHSMPAGVDFITLPGLSKGVDGICKPRYLDLPLK